MLNSSGSLSSLFHTARTVFSSVSLVVLVVALSGCGSGASGETPAFRQVTITLPPADLASLNSGAPADTFVFYVTDSSVPAGASDLVPYSLYVCTGQPWPDDLSVGAALGMTHINSTISNNDTGCIQNAIKAGNTIIILRRPSATPSGAPLPSGAALVELVFK
jgi:hypothetical protein